MNRLLKSKLINDSFWALFGNIVGKGLALAAGIIVARFLGKDIYGEYGIIRNTLMSLTIFSTFGLGYTATKYVAEYKNSKPEYIKIILKYCINITLIVSGIMALLLLISANYISENILNAPHLTIPLRLVAVWIVFNAVTTTHIGFLAGFNEFKGMTRVNTITGVATFITSLVFTYLWKLEGALIALLISQILNWYLNLILVKKHKSKLFSDELSKKNLIKEIINFSFPVALQEATYSITTWLTSLILIKLSGYGQLGLFSAAIQWNAIILFIPGILRNVILSHLSESVNNQNQHIRVLKLTLFINFLVTFTLSIAVFLMSDLIVGFYGSTFIGLKEVIRFAIIITIFSSLTNVYTQAYLSKGKSWLIFFIRFIRDAGVLLLSYFLLVYTEGNLGAMALIYSSLILDIFFLLLLATIFHLELKYI
ncbi:MAG: oligosaccharide flippase family protein [Bacteroidia bacterium]|nr:oligosaccharide flippase family protein [Bacteroidia bacterium]